MDNIVNSGYQGVVYHFLFFVRKFFVLSVHFYVENLLAFDILSFFHFGMSNIFLDNSIFYLCCFYCDWIYTPTLFIIINLINKQYLGLLTQWQSTRLLRATPFFTHFYEAIGSSIPSVEFVKPRLIQKGMNGKSSMSYQSITNSKSISLLYVSGPNFCLNSWLGTKKFSWVSFIKGQSLAALIIGKQKVTSFHLFCI